MQSFSYISLQYCFLFTFEIEGEEEAKLYVYAFLFFSKHVNEGFVAKLL